MSRPSKKPYNQKIDFSDEEIYEEIKEEIRQIKESNLKKVDEEMKIYELYISHKQEKKKQKLISNKSDKPAFNVGTSFKHRSSSSEEEEEGEIQEKTAKSDHFIHDFVLSISNLGDHIRPLTITRNKIVDLLNSRRFQELVKGCFVRYLIDSNMSSTTNSYIIAQIVGVTEGNKEYLVNNVKTKVLLKLQETSESVVTLSLQLISNQHPPGGLEIEKWLQTNRNKMPKEKELKEKLEELNKLLVEQLSSGEIDSNIWKKAQQIAEDNKEPKEDINPLLDFVGEKLHNLEVRIEDEKIGRNTKGESELAALEGEIVVVKDVFEKLNNLREAIRKNRQQAEKSRGPRKEKKYNLNLIEQKRKDDINQKCKARGIMLSTYEGYSKLKQILLENHMKYNFELDEEDKVY